jgi:hypothetical protein
MSISKKIIELVEDRKNVLANDPTRSKVEATRTGKLAVAAIIGGIRSAAWREYMLQFGESTPLLPEQLERLLATDGTLGDVDLDLRRAYLVSNGTCGAASPDTQGLAGNVATIDNPPRQ